MQFSFKFNKMAILTSIHEIFHEEMAENNKEYNNEEMNKQEENNEESSKSDEVTSPYCKPCLQRFNKRILHSHYSSRHYNCEIQRNRIIIFSTILHGALPTVTGEITTWSGMLQTIQYENIQQGTLTELYRNWRATYLTDNSPMHIVLVVDYQEIDRVSPDDMMKVLQAWDFEIHQQDLGSTIRICRISRPPARCWFLGNGAPPIGHVNRIEDFNKLNNLIIQFNNMRGHGPVIGFGTEGCRTKKNGSTQHKQNDWTSEENDNKWYNSNQLKLKVRARMLVKLHNFIQNRLITEIL